MADVGIPDAGFETVFRRNLFSARVTVGTAGTYAVDVRVASNGAGGTFHLEVDGVNVTGSMTVPTTGGWQVWNTITRTGVQLTAGAHVVRVVMDANGATGSIANFNWFAIR